MWALYITLVTMRMHGAIIKHAYPYLYLEGQRTSLSSLVHMEAERRSLERIWSYLGPTRPLMGKPWWLQRRCAQNLTLPPS
jgi:hypothetical protein